MAAPAAARVPRALGHKEEDGLLGLERYPLRDTQRWSSVQKGPAGAPSQRPRRHNASAAAPCVRVCRHLANHVHKLADGEVGRDKELLLVNQRQRRVARPLLHDDGDAVRVLCTFGGGRTHGSVARAGGGNSGSGWERRGGAHG